MKNEAKYIRRKYVLAGVTLDPRVIANSSDEKWNYIVKNIESKLIDLKK